MNGTHSPTIKPGMNQCAHERKAVPVFYNTPVLLKYIVKSDKVLSAIAERQNLRKKENSTTK